MERGNNFRLLKLQEILFRKTDEYNDLTLQEIHQELQRESDDYKADDRTIKRDLTTLDEADFEIIQDKGKFGKILYSHQSRLFETYQLRLMVDAIMSARFITGKEKKDLISKIKKLTSDKIAETLPEPLFMDQGVNADYEKVKLNIDGVHRAISGKKVLQYKYGKYNINKEFTYNRGGETYHVEPYALVWQNDYYYLIGKFQQTDEMRHYRLDRMREIHVSTESFTRDELDVREYVNQSFHMFSGEEIRIKVRFHMNLLNVVLDRFGQQADIRQAGENAFDLSTKAKLSEGLINWILTWGNKAQVLSPEYLVEEVKEKIRKMQEVYE